MENPLKRVGARATPEPVSTGLAYQTPNSFGGAFGDAAALLRPIRALISDLDGTLVAGNRPQPGLLPFLELLACRGVALTVVTNNTVRTPEQYRGKLAALGATLAAGPDHHRSAGNRRISAQRAARPPR